MKLYEKIEIGVEHYINRNPDTDLKLGEIQVELLLRVLELYEYNMEFMLDSI